MAAWTSGSLSRTASGRSSNVCSACCHLPASLSAVTAAVYVKTFAAGLLPSSLAPCPCARSKRLSRRSASSHAPPRWHAAAADE